MGKLFLIRNLLLIFVVIQCVNVFAQTQAQTQTQIDTNNLIKKIRLSYVDISKNQNEYKKKAKRFLEGASEGGDVEGYYDGNDLKKMVVTYCGEMGKTITEYYFNDNILLFIIDIQILYDNPIYVKGFKVKEKDEERYYFYNGILFRWLKGTKTVKKGLIEKQNYLNKEIFDQKKFLEGS